MASHHEVEAELVRLPKAKRKGPDVVILCPFHGDHEPSCGVNVDPNKPAGIFKCWSCGESGGWRKLAKALDLPTLNDGAIDRRVRKPPKPNPKETADSVCSFGGSIGSGKQTNKPGKRARKWPKDREWRGIRGGMVRWCGGRISKTGKLMLPVERLGLRGIEFAGAIFCSLDKSDGQPPYLYSKGSDMKRGLFPLTGLLRMVGKRRPSSLVLVEGSRDAMALMQRGIPSLAVLGASMCGFDKMMGVATVCRHLGLRPLVVMDGDEAGDAARKDAVLALGRNWGLGPWQIDLLQEAPGADPFDVATDPDHRGLLKKIKMRAGI